MPRTIITIPPARHIVIYIRNCMGFLFRNRPGEASSLSSAFPVTMLLMTVRTAYMPQSNVNTAIIIVMMHFSAIIEPHSLCGLTIVVLAPFLLGSAHICECICRMPSSWENRAGQGLDFLFVILAGRYRVYFFLSPYCRNLLTDRNLKVKYAGDLKIQIPKSG